MKRILLIGMCLVFCASMAFAQGSIMVFSDVGASTCTFVDTGGLVQVHIFHMFSPGAKASEWMLDIGGQPWTLLGFVSDFGLIIGDPLSGAAFSYEGCLQGNINLGVANFFGSSAPLCTYIGIVAAPGKGGVRTVDCQDFASFIPGGQGIVNPDGSSCDCTTPVEDRTWGGIKALYE